jgi:hypothetical protein
MASSFDDGGEGAASDGVDNDADEWTTRRGCDGSVRKKVREGRRRGRRGGAGSDARVRSGWSGGLGATLEGGRLFRTIGAGSVGAREDKALSRWGIL